MQTCNKKFQEDKFQNKTLLESQNFRVIPSIGAIVEGWVLLIPKSHYISFSEMSDTLLNEANRMIKKIHVLLKEAYNCEIVSFENGANSENNKIGCGVDYAHIHFVPIEIDLKQIIESVYNNIKWNKILSIKDVKKLRGFSYYYISTGSNKLVTIAPYPKSQLIRQGIASAIGIPNSFNWKEYPFYNNVNNTINKLQSKTTKHEFVFA